MMMGFKEYSQKGTYAALKPTKEDAKALYDIYKSLGVPNVEQSNKLHCTLLYSRKFLPNYKPEPDVKFNGSVTGVEIWPTKSGKNCLVMKFTSPKIVKRHNQLMDEHKATYDYPEYKTHLSLSYDVGDFDTSTIEDKLPKAITLTGEYQEELDTTGK